MSDYIRVYLVLQFCLHTSICVAVVVVKWMLPR